MAHQNTLIDRRVSHVPAGLDVGELLTLGRARFEAGYWQGIGQAAMLFPLRLNRLKVSAEAVRRFDEIVALACPLQASESPVMLDAVLSGHPVVGRLLRMSIAILEKMGMPVMGGATAVKRNKQNPGDWVVALPAISDTVPAPQVALDLACELMNALAAGRHVRSDAVAAQIEKHVRKFQRLAPAGLNTLRFLQAAHELGVPWRHVANNVYQFGWGSRSRWLDSSFTDRTSFISSALARNKRACAQVLRGAGLPVPRHQLVSSAEQALRVAQILGYPVVVKAANLDGGLGVFAGLRTPEAVQRAYEAVIKLSRQVLVEQFIEGQDYRLQVFQGEVFWVAHRRPAGVLGDGLATVAELVERLNLLRAQPMAASAPDVMSEIGRKPIALDEEANEWLQAQALTLAAVPQAGRFVRLRGAANVSQGGTREGVPLSALHPDNRDLAVRAVSALRLDLAGVDLLVPDIGRSWKETGGAICEINAQPQLSAHLPRLLLDELLQGRGRVPVLGLCLPASAWDDAPFLQKALADKGVRLSIVGSAVESWRALGEADVDAVLWMMDSMPPDGTAMPVDVLDLLVLAQEQVSVRVVTAAKQWLVGDPARGADMAVSDLTHRLLEYLVSALKAGR